MIDEKIQEAAQYVQQLIGEDEMFIGKVDDIARVMIGRDINPDLDEDVEFLRAESSVLQQVLQRVADVYSV